MYRLIASLAVCMLAALVYYGLGADVETRHAARFADHTRLSRHIDPLMYEPVITISSANAEAQILAAATLAPTTEPTPTVAGHPVEDVEFASIDDDIRFSPTTRPAEPSAQHPPEADAKNVDTGKPVHQWQRMTDDWFGTRPWLDDHGISFQASMTMDWTTFPVGGVGNNSSALRELLNANITLDTDRLMGWKGGTFFANFQQQTGENGSADAGDLQPISNIDADGRTQLSELWFEQAFGDRIRVKVGKIDANADFAHTPDADEFINNSFAAQPVILGFPTYPDPAMGLTLFVNPTEKTYLGAGVFDGSTLAGHRTGDIGPAGFFHGASHLFYIGEAGIDWTAPRQLDGRFSVGLWHDTSDFDRFNGGSDSSSTGPYVMLDQQLWRENPSDKDDHQGIGLFAKYGYADPNVSAITHNIAAGMAWTGPIPGRDDDVFGLGVSWAGLSDHAGLTQSNETVYEMFYRLRLTTWFSIKPDLQYITHPAAGADGDTLAATVRMVIDF